MADRTKDSASIARCRWEPVGLGLIVTSYGRCVSVSKRLDQLMNESFVADLGYPADQATIARVVRGLQLLADEIDAIDTQVAQVAQVTQVTQVAVAGVAGVAEVAEVADDPPASVAPEQAEQAGYDTPTVHADHDSPIGLE
jgi:hypothetical protein